MPDDHCAQPRPHRPAASAAGAPASGRRRRRLTARRAALLAALAVLAALAAVLVPRLLHTPTEPVYVALVTSRTAPGGPRAPEVALAVQFHADRVNQAGGVHGHPVRLLSYDDRADPDTARRTAERIVRDDRVALVIGHTSSPTAAAAGRVYSAAGIPFITPTATADGITAGPWCFRTTYTNSAQGAFLAAYARHVLSARTATVLYADSAYGTTLANGFRRAFTDTTGRVDHAIAVDEQPGPQRTRQLQQALDAVRADSAKGPVLLAVPEQSALAVLEHLRSHGMDNTVVAGDDLSQDRFGAALTASAQERARPGSMTSRFYAASPQLPDSLTGAGLAWAAAYRDRYGDLPSWRAMSAQTATDMAVHALRQARAPHGHVTPRARTAVRDALAAMNDREHAIPGVYGDQVHFDATRSLYRPVSIGMVQNGRIISAPVQLTEYTPEESTDAAADLAAGRAVPFLGRVLARQQIVYTGINFNRISALNTRAGTFEADFFLWLRYSGSDEAADIEFLNAADSKTAPGTPVRRSEDAGIKYRLHQVSAKFTSSLDFHRFPFDEQHLKIVMQNRDHPSSRVVYVIDQPMLSQDHTEAFRSGKDVGTSIDGLPNWDLRDLRTYKAAVGSTARLGDPDLGRADKGIHYAQYVAEISVHRDVGPFLIKNLLPLLLSVAVTYATLFFPRDPRYTSTRVNLEVTAMLSAAVLLTGVTSSLPDIGYSVAIEWAYYAFMFLVGTCVFISLAGAWLVEHDNIRAWNRLAHVSRVYYLVFCLGVVVAYVVRFG
ncbi:ABC transporter substrate-binding protein [Streptomyces sp. AHA2]|uniref:ABC transporter substrate-binding protein n=1 Tax=Streptomyces sp. AHA2 TaxID=3064526 RepID=UPI002FE29784